MQRPLRQSRGGERGTQCALCVLSCLLLLLGMLLAPLFTSPESTSEATGRLPVLRRDPLTAQDPEILQPDGARSLSAESGDHRDGNGGSTDATSQSPSARQGEMMAPTVHTLDDASKEDSSDVVSSFDTQRTVDDGRLENSTRTQELSLTPQDHSSWSDDTDDTSELKTDTDQNTKGKSQNPLHGKGDKAPYNPHTAEPRPLDIQSFSLTGRQCGEDRCSTRYDQTFRAVLVTHDERIVLADTYGRSLSVQSVTGVDTLSVGCNPSDLAQLSNGILVVTCRYIHVFLLVKLDKTRGYTRLIKTKKRYSCVAVNPEDNTLIVSPSFDDDATVDVITTRGQFLRTLVGGTQMELRHIFSLTVVGGQVLVTSDYEIARVPLWGNTRSAVDMLRHPLLSSPIGTTADSQGNVFIAQITDMVMKTTDDRYRRLMMTPDVNPAVIKDLAVHGNRLLVVNSSIGMEGCTVTEYVMDDP